MIKRSSFSLLSPGTGQPATVATSATQRVSHHQTSWLSEFDAIQREIQHRYWEALAKAGGGSTQSTQPPDTTRKPESNIAVVEQTTTNTGITRGDS